jgi:serine/threonine protein kinase
VALASDAELGEAFLKVTVKAIAALLPVGGAVAIAFDQLVEPFCKAGWKYLQELLPKERERALTGVANTDPNRAADVLREALANTDLDNSTKSALVAYLSFIPMRVRSGALQVDRDSGSTLLTMLPPDENSLAKYLPLRALHFQAATLIPHHDYRLVRLLGQGGFGEVWSATNSRRPNRPPVAIKFCLESKVVVSLEREIELLDHLAKDGGCDYIVMLLDNALANDPPFLVFEYAEGGDLSAWLARRGERRANERDVLRILTMSARGLRYAHDRGVVHRDLKPSNLLITKGMVKIADFGIGHLVQSRSQPASPAQRQVTALLGAGTPMYVDLETNDDKQRDVYALGVIAYQLALGDITRPVPAGWRSNLQKRGFSPQFIEIIAKCLDIPSERFVDGSALCAVLEAHVQSGPVEPLHDVTQTASIDSSLQPVAISGSTSSRRNHRQTALLWALGTVMVVAVAIGQHFGKAKDESVSPLTATPKLVAATSSAKDRCDGGETTACTSLGKSDPRGRGAAIDTERARTQTPLEPLTSVAEQAPPPSSVPNAPSVVGDEPIRAAPDPSRAARPAKANRGWIIVTNPQSSETPDYVTLDSHAVSLERKMKVLPGEHTISARWSSDLQKTSICVARASTTTRCPLQRVSCSTNQRHIRMCDVPPE